MKTAKDATKSAALKAFESKYGDHNFSQSGQAGAVPAAGSAPLIGGPHEDANNNPSAGGMAEQATEAMKQGHGSNGTSYDNKER